MKGNPPTKRKAVLLAPTVQDENHEHTSAAAAADESDQGSGKRPKGDSRTKLEKANLSLFSRQVAAIEALPNVEEAKCCRVITD